MQIKDDDRLKALFSELKPMEPTPGFEKALMSRVKREARVEAWLYMLLLPTVGVTVMIGVIAFILRYLEIDLQLASLLAELDFGNISWEYVLLPSVVLLLLVADTLIRKHLRKRQGKAEI